MVISLPTTDTTGVQPAAGAGFITYPTSAGSNYGVTMKPEYFLVSSIGTWEVNVDWKNECGIA